MSAGKENGGLARTIGLFALVVYGVGDMVGAGVYATIGAAAGKMGNAVWLAFSVSMVAALLTGLSYASLCFALSPGGRARLMSLSVPSASSFFPMSLV